jgi:protein-tyrosine-phosphatase
MAQAFFEAMAPEDIGAESAGRDPVPRIWPTVVEVMSEVGIDMMPLTVARAIRADVEERVRDLVENRIDAIRSDRTAHELRLARILPQLVSEFERTRSAEEIHACADVILSQFDDAPVRSHVFTLAYRRMRECLQHEQCDAFAVPDIAILN